MPMDQQSADPLSQATVDALQTLLRSNPIVHPADRTVCNDCCDTDDSDDMVRREYTGPVSDSLTFRFLQSLADSLRHHPHRRYHVVDWPETATHSEDSIWLSLPKWLGSADVQWSVCTFKTIGRSGFRRIFESTDGCSLHSLQHGSCMVRADVTPTPTSEGSWKSRAFFSDQPRLVSRYGQDMANVSRIMTIRVFRCAPIPSLKRNIQAVLAEPPRDNVLDLWIRHHDMGAYGGGDHDIWTFQHALDAVQGTVDLGSLLTDVEKVPRTRMMSPRGPWTPTHAATLEPGWSPSGGSACSGHPTETDSHSWDRSIEGDGSSQDVPTPEQHAVTVHEAAATADIVCQPDGDAGRDVLGSAGIGANETGNKLVDLLVPVGEASKQESLSEAKDGEESDVFGLGQAIGSKPSLVCAPRSLESADATASAIITPRYSFDDSVLNPLGTELDSAQKHLNKLNHLSPIFESPLFVGPKTCVPTSPDSSPSSAGEETPLSSPSDVYTKFPWHTPVPATPATKQAGPSSVELLLNELATIVGWEPSRIAALPVPWQTPSKDSKKSLKFSTPQVTDEVVFNIS